MRWGEPQEEQVQPKRKKKKMKADRTTNSNSLDSDDVQLMTEEITETTQTNSKSIEEQKE